MTDMDMKMGPIHNSTRIMIDLGPKRDRCIPSCQQSSHYWSARSRVLVAGATSDSRVDRVKFMMKKSQKIEEINITQHHAFNSVSRFLNIMRYSQPQNPIIQSSSSSYQTIMNGNWQALSLISRQCFTYATRRTVACASHLKASHW